MHALVCATDHASNSHTYRRKYHSKQAPKYTTTTNVQFYREKYDTYMSLIAHRFFSMLFQFIHIIWLVFSLGADDMNTVDCGIGSFFSYPFWTCRKCLLQKGLDVFSCDLTNTITCTMLARYFFAFRTKKKETKTHKNRKIQAYFVQIIIKFAFSIYYTFFCAIVRFTDSYLNRVEDLCDCKAVGSIVCLNFKLNKFHI